MEVDACRGPPSFQSLNGPRAEVELARCTSTRSIGVSVPSCRPAAATMILNTEPGGYCAWIVAVQQRVVGILHHAQPRVAVDRAR